MGNRNSGAQQVKYVGNTDVFVFGFNFMSPKWTRTQLIFVVSLPNRPNEAYRLYGVTEFQPKRALSNSNPNG